MSFNVKENVSTTLVNEEQKTVVIKQDVKPKTLVVGVPGLPGKGLPPGGTTGQVPKKLSDADYDIGWENESGGGAVSSVFGRTGAVTAQNGDYNTDQVTEATNLYFTAARAIAALTGQNITLFNNNAGFITNLTGFTTDNLAEGATHKYYANSLVQTYLNTLIGMANGLASLDGTGKIPLSQIPASIIGSLNYQGSWNANTNNPALASGVGTKGYYYVVSVAGSTNLDGITDWKVGDWAIYSGSAWQKIDNTDAVLSVNGQIGVVVLNTDNIGEGGLNLYFTNARARGALSGGTGINYNNSTGVITNSAPDQIVTLAGGANVTITGTYPNFTISATGGGTPGGVNGNVQINVNGALGANTFFNYDTTTNRLEAFGSLGTEKVTNGTFTGSASGWTLGSGFVYSSNSVSKTSNGTAALSQNIGVVLGEIYQLTFDISNLTAGTVTPSIGGVSSPAVSANGSYSVKIIPTNNSVLAFTPSNTARFTIDNISVKKLQDGSIATESLGVGGVNYAPSSTKAMINFNHTAGTPGSQRAVQYNNAGTNTWEEYYFGGVSKAAIGVSSSGEISQWASGGNYFSWYSKAFNSVIAYLYPGAFQHYGLGLFGSGVNAGSTGSPASTLDSQGSRGGKVKKLTASGTLDGSGSKWIINATNASACTGTPTYPCSHWANPTECAANSAHGGCNYNYGNPCSNFNYEYGMGTCSGTTGCTADQNSCSSAGDESSCYSQDDSYGGDCAWTNNPQSCAGFDESTCSMTMGCSPNFSPCTNNYINPCSWDGSQCTGGGECDFFFDESSCNSYQIWSYCSGGGNCSSQTDESSCSSTTYFDSCGGSYDNYSCTGNYYTGNCSGSYGAQCEGTSSCINIGNSTDCGAEAGCVWSAALTLNLPDMFSVPGRDYEIVKEGSGGTINIKPYGDQTINGSGSYSMTADKEHIHISPFADAASCGAFDESTCTATAGCSPYYNTCSWDGSTCSGNPVCDSIYDGSTCMSTNYYAGCYGTYYLSKNWWLF